MSRERSSHISKHKKKYVRFIIFFFLVYIFRTYENYLMIKATGVTLDIDFANYLVIILIATVFTFVAEATEKIIEEEEAKIENFIKNEMEEEIEFLKESI